MPQGSLCLDVAQQADHARKILADVVAQLQREIGSPSRRRHRASSARDVRADNVPRACRVDRCSPPRFSARAFCGAPDRRRSCPAAALYRTSSHRSGQVCCARNRGNPSNRHWRSYEPPSRVGVMRMASERSLRECPGPGTLQESRPVTSPPMTAAIWRTLNGNEGAFMTAPRAARRHESTLSYVRRWCWVTRISRPRYPKHPSLRAFRARKDRHGANSAHAL